MEEISINILVDAKNEYTKQLTNILVPYVYEGVESIYQDALNMEDKNVLKQFQYLLQKVPKWNQEMIDTETKRIIDASKCTYLGDLLTAVFVANAKILTAVASIHKGKKIQLRVPQISEFIHKCYIESAREFYKNPYLFDKSCRSIEKHRNLRESLSNINNAIVEAVRKLLPMQEILQQYLGESLGMHEEDISFTPNQNQKGAMKFDKKFMKYDDSDGEEGTETPVKEIPPLPEKETPEKDTPPLTKESLPTPLTKESLPTPPLTKESLPTPLKKESLSPPPLPPSTESSQVKEIITKTEKEKEKEKEKEPEMKVIDVEKDADDDEEEEQEAEVEVKEEVEVEDDSLTEEELTRLEEEIKNVEVSVDTGVQHNNRTRRIIRRKKHKDYVVAEQKMNKELGFFNDAGNESGSGSGSE